VLGLFPAPNRSPRANPKDFEMKNDRLISVAASAVVKFVKGGGLVYSSLPDFPIIRKAKVRGLQRAVFRLAEARCIRSCRMELAALSRKNEESMPKVFAEQTTETAAKEAGRLILGMIQENKEWEVLSYYGQELFLKEISKKTGITVDDPYFYSTSKTTSSCYVDVGFPHNVAVTLPNAKQGIAGEVIGKLELLERSAQFDADHDYPDCSEGDWDVV
jgi:hypothetical protein